MDWGILALHVATAFGAGWLVVALVTTIADVYGAGKAGFIGGLPSTGPVGLLFIGWSQSQGAAVSAASIFPLAFSVTFVFLLLYALPAGRSFGARIALALPIWLALSVLTALMHPADYLTSLVLSIVISSLVFVIHRRRKFVDVPPVRTPPSWDRALLRGTLGGCVVAAVAVLTAVGGPEVGGVFTAAPAIWSSSLYVSSRAHGVEFSRSLTNSFATTGILTIIPYGVAARFLFAAEGVWVGTLLAYLAIAPVVWIAWRMTSKKGGEHAETSRLKAP